MTDQPTVPAEVLALAEILDRYHRLNHPLAAADVIIGLGTHDPRVAERAAELFHQGWAPYLLFTGGVSRWTQGLYPSSEARAFADIAIGQGVPADCIGLEEQATNTGENIRFARALLEGEERACRRLILVQKPYMERRTHATCACYWPEAQSRVTSPRIGLADYPRPWLPLEEVVHVMVGDLHRILVYPQRGFQVAQDVPPDVREAFQKLVDLGYNRHLVPEPS